MNIFRGIFNRMSQGRSANRGPGGDDSDDESGGMRGAQSDAHPRKRPPRKLPKQCNSDWNEIVEEADNTNLFFGIFNAPQQAANDAR